MNPSRIEIHEFSTGIQVERVGTGWVSRGFTGEYMNRTLDLIPVAVQQAITNRDFAVAEGASSDEPAVIGREISANGEQWSVIAVVTKGRDDRGRSASMYRYFLCKEIGNLGNILAWIINQRPFPVFNPYDTRIIGNPAIHQNTGSDPINLRPELQSLLVNNPTPIIIPWQQPCAPLILNEMARQISGNQPISWAFKVEALEQPTRFQVIQPASEKAEQLLQRITAITPQYTVNISGEQSIKSAIKGLSSREQVKIEQILILENALNDPQINENYWKSLFDSQGAAQSRSQGIYSPQMVRLLTLQAILIPERLSDYLIWMSKRGKQDDHYQTSENFQTEIRNALRPVSNQTPKLTNNLVDGVKSLIPSLLEHPEQVEVAVWLLQLPNGLWKKYYDEKFIPELERDLKLMLRTKGKNNLSFEPNIHPRWKPILERLSIFWRNDYTPKIEYYKPLANLFEQLEKPPELAAFFSYVAYGKGKISKKIISNLPKQNGGNPNFYGIQLKRKVTKREKLFLAFKKTLLINIKCGEFPMQVPVWSVLVILFIFTGLGFRAGLMVGLSKADKQLETVSVIPPIAPTSESSNRADETKIPKILPDPSTTQPPEPQIDKTTLDNAVKEFDKRTKVAIEDIIKNAGGSSNKSAKEQIMQILVLTNLKYDSITTADPKKKETWVKAIYTYQKNNGLPADGIIDPVDQGGKTAISIETKLKKNPAK